MLLVLKRDSSPKSQACGEEFYFVDPAFRFNPSDPYIHGLTKNFTAKGAQKQAKIFESLGFEISDESRVALLKRV